jgi:hypothetical protein
VKPSTSPYDHKVTIANLFGGIPSPVVLEEKFALGGTPQTLSSPGAISITANVTTITSPSANGELTIADGVDGQFKTIIMVSNSGSRTLSITNNIGHSSIVFNGAGDTATLMFQGTLWYFIGGTATVT